MISSNVEEDQGKYRFTVENAGKVVYTGWTNTKEEAQRTIERFISRNS